MYVVAINGSPRPDGNTALLLREALKPLAADGWETEFVQFGGKAVRGCSACGGCRIKKDGRCVLPDDGFNAAMAKMVRADAVLVGSPTYYADVNAETKALLDRAGFSAMGAGGLFRGKIGAAVVAVRRAGAVHAFDSINHMFMISQMIVPGSTYWNLGVGLDRGEVAGDGEAMFNMRNLGEMIALLGRAIAPLKDRWPDPGE